MALIETEIKDRVAWVTLNRPDKRNALSDEMVGRLTEAVESLEINPEVRAIVLRARGRVFCAGADLEGLEKMQNASREENRADSRRLLEMYRVLYDTSKPVIAQVQGHALAGGCGLVTVCDFAFAVPEAKFGYTEVRIGFVPALVSVFLSRKIGNGAALQLLMGGGVVSASEAQHLGLIYRVVTADSLDAEVAAFVQNLLSDNSGVAMSATKRLLRQVEGLPLDKALSLAAETNALARESKDCREGIAAFLAKKDKSW
ncbi:MAG: enoyl-CoA hydratase-related protein [Cyclobacteriaceae bacterium]|nr:enoyl-CoA hydratase-related protein [Cyclobacteriaceae bacterium]